jgi:methylated-DNA-[protein]-cysteine S-methyltransferase
VLGCHGGSGYGLPAAASGTTVDAVLQLLSHPTPIGPLLLVATDAGVVTVSYRSEPPAALGGSFVDGGEHVERAAAELDEYFAGGRRAFEFPLDWQLARGFTREVLEALCDVPYGETVTYGELATLAGRPGAARAVGGAMAANPLAVVVPCHRVVAAGRRIGGYSGGSGLDTKRALLALEGAQLSATGPG